MTTGPAEAIGRPRAELLRQRSLRQAWVLVVAGLLIPFFALGGARTGYRLRRREGGRGHELLIAAGLTVFVVRAVVWVTTGVV
jgi:ABC-type uncharacterized transport system permease subunit